MPYRTIQEKAEYDRIYREKHATKLKACRLKSYQSHKIERRAASKENYYKNRSQQLMGLYNLSEEGLKWWLAITECEICGSDKNVSFDHNHTLEPIKVRGRLCLGCNTALGSLKDNADNLMVAVNYLQQRKWPKKCYVAAKFEEYERAREIMRWLQASGHTITHDWTRTKGIGPMQAIADLRGVTDADVFVGIFEKNLKYTGALVELGAALATGKLIYILGKAPVTESLFFKSPHIRWGEEVFMRDLLGVGGIA